jgi:hypothetical protein
MKYKNNLKYKILLLLILILASTFYIKKENFDSHTETICESIFLDKNNLKYKVLENLFNKKQCKLIIKESEKYAKKHKWKKRRHENYPTIDNRITEKWKIWNIIYKQVKNKIFPTLESMYNLRKNKLGINEIFIIKYSENGQRKLKYHKDGSMFSFIIGLNDDFTGGGTTFKKTGKRILLKPGEGLVFSGQNRHKGNYITSGTRYILAGFFNYEGEGYCENYIKNYRRFNW